jgi:adenylate kinase
MNVVLIGPPGSGKGTQGERIAQRLDLVHLASGDLLRAEARADTARGRQLSDTMQRGELVADQLILELVLPHVLTAAAHGGYVLDGFPRSVSQAEEIRRAIGPVGAEPDAVVYLDVPREELLRRILARAEKEGRADDNPETVGNRLRVFEKETAPLIEHYRERGLLRRVDAARDVDSVTDDIMRTLGG